MGLKVDKRALRVILDRRHMSPTGLADRTGVTAAYVRMLLAGERDGIAPSTAAAFARALDVPPSLLFDRDGHPVSDVNAGLPIWSLSR